MAQGQLLKQTKYLNFVEISDSGKTKVIGVGNNSGEKLAYIKWDTAWRRYVLLPFANMQFDVTCLNEISSFITELMDARKTG